MVFFNLCQEGTLLNHSTYFAGTNGNNSAPNICHIPNSRDYIITCNSSDNDAHTTAGAYQSTKINGNNVYQPFVFKIKNELPTIDFDTVIDHCANTVQFSYNSTGLCSHYWEFGDGIQVIN